MSTPADSFGYDHALLYCIGVNLPNHQFGQLDRVLVVASPINDMNIHAWNLSRVKRFMIIEAGIQMDLCSNCMGHRKKTVTFVISPKFIPDCIRFLVKEARLSEEPKQMPMQDGPLYYNVPHSCSLVTENSEDPTQCPVMYTNAEKIVLGKEENEVSASVGLYINYDARNRVHSTCSTTTTTTTSSVTPPFRTSTSVQPTLPPRGISRTSRTLIKSSSTQTKNKDDHFNHLPYRINHRIYLNTNGVLREDSDILGSQGWEHTGSRITTTPRSPVVPPRFEDSSMFHPVYVDDDDIHSPPPPPPPPPPTLSQPPSFQRPEFIGRNPPCLPPRGSPQFSKRSSSASNILEHISSSPNQTRRNNSVFNSEPPSYYDDTLMYQNVPNSNGYDMTRRYSYNQQTRSPSPQMCTDDITNADFAMITTLKFSGQILPPRTNTTRRPIPLPRTRKPSNITTSATVVQNTLETDFIISEQDTEEVVQVEDKGYSLNPMYAAIVGKEAVTTSSSPSCSSRGSPVFSERRLDNSIRCNSFSCSFSWSEDFQSHRTGKKFLKKYSHEI